MTQVIYSTDDFSFDRSWISDAALKVVNGLQDAGFDGYLVGGCVRDLLLQRRPKDFDITTNANPQQIKKIFSRALIIGRRFKIVHVKFGREVIEVATYRAKPDSATARRFFSRKNHRKPINDSGRVVDDNVFGTIEQDAARRDFTINSLYYDPNRELVVDYLGGVKDIKKNTIRMNGAATKRFTEDPVRMLRAVRFRAKLGLELEQTLPPAIADCSGLLKDVPPARLLDEMIKLFHHGHALHSWAELRSFQLAGKLFPMTVTKNNAGNDLINMAMENTDLRVREEKPVIVAFLFAVLLWLPFSHELKQQQRSHKSNKRFYETIDAAADVVFRKQSQQIAMPHHMRQKVMEIWAMQFDLEKCEPKEIAYLLAHKRFRAAYDFLLLRQRVGEVDESLARWWTDIQNYDAEKQQQQIERLRNEPVHTHKDGNTKNNQPGENSR